MDRAKSSEPPDDQPDPSADDFDPPPVSHPVSTDHMLESAYDSALRRLPQPLAAAAARATADVQPASTLAHSLDDLPDFIAEDFHINSPGSDLINIEYLQLPDGPAYDEPNLPSSPDLPSAEPNTFFSAPQDPLQPVRLTAASSFRTNTVATTDAPLQDLVYTAAHQLQVQNNDHGEKFDQTIASMSPSSPSPAHNAQPPPPGTSANAPQPGASRRSRSSGPNKRPRSVRAPNNAKQSPIKIAPRAIPPTHDPASSPSVNPDAGATTTTDKIVSRQAPVKLRRHTNNRRQAAQRAQKPSTAITQHIPTPTPSPVLVDPMRIRVSAASSSAQPSIPPMSQVPMPLPTRHPNMISIMPGMYPMHPAMFPHTQAPASPSDAPPDKIMQHTRIASVHAEAGTTSASLGTKPVAAAAVPPIIGGIQAKATLAGHAQPLNQAPTGPSTPSHFQVMAALQAAQAANCAQPGQQFFSPGVIPLSPGVLYDPNAMQYLPFGQHYTYPNLMPPLAGASAAHNPQALLSAVKGAVPAGSASLSHPNGVGSSNQVGANSDMSVASGDGTTGVSNPLLIGACGNLPSQVTGNGTVGISGPLTTSSRPVVVNADGVQVQLLRQPPARLDRHPVLGRLQLSNGVKTITTGTMIEPKDKVNVTHLPRVSRNDGMPKCDSSAALSSASTGNMMPSARGARFGDLPLQSGGDDVVTVGARGQESNGRKPKKRLVWTPELHERFVKAFEAVGLQHAVPKTLVNIMNVEGLTTDHVKSHLQKYRNLLKKEEDEEVYASPSASASESAGAASDLDRREGRRQSVSVKTDIGKDNHPDRLIEKHLKAPCRNDMGVVSRDNEESFIKEGVASQKQVVLGGSEQVVAGRAVDDDDGLDEDNPDGLVKRNRELELVKEKTLEMQLQLQKMVHRTVALERRYQQGQKNLGEEKQESGRSGRSEPGNYKNDGPSGRKDVDSDEITPAHGSNLARGGNRCSVKRKAIIDVKLIDQTQGTSDEVLGLEDETSKDKRRRKESDIDADEIKALKTQQFELHKQLAELKKHIRCDGTDSAHQQAQADARDVETFEGHSSGDDA